MTVHGGDVWKVSLEHGISTSEILDFSANINPRGLPPKARQRLVQEAQDDRLLSFYPDPEANHLRDGLSKQLDCAPESIVVGSGAESLLSPILRSLAVHRALIPIPAFSEYRRVCLQESVEFVPFQLSRENNFQVPLGGLTRCMAESNCDVVLLNNPHNPSGALLRRKELGNLLECAHAARIPLILDEAFIDYAETESFVREAAETPGLIVVRSLTKFYGCPALRVGYAVTHPDTISRIRSFLPTWGVSQFAQNALAEAVTDSCYAEASLRENLADRLALTESLSNLGCIVFPSVANYLLFESPKDAVTSSELRRRLIDRHCILIRNCDSYEGLERGRYVRVAVRTKNDNQRLLEALAKELR